MKHNIRTRISRAYRAWRIHRKKVIRRRKVLASKLTRMLERDVPARRSRPLTYKEWEKKYGDKVRALMGEGEFTIEGPIASNPVWTRDIPQAEKDEFYRNLENEEFVMDVLSSALKGKYFTAEEWVKTIDLFAKKGTRSEKEIRDYVESNFEDRDVPDNAR